MDVSSFTFVHQATNMSGCKQTFEQVEDELAKASAWATHSISRDSIEYSLLALKLYVNSFNAAVHFSMSDNESATEIAAVNFQLGEYEKSFQFGSLLCANMPPEANFTESERRVRQMGKRIEVKCADMDTKNTAVVLNMTLTSAMSMACNRLGRPPMQPPPSATSSLLESSILGQQFEKSAITETAHQMSTEVKSSMINWVMAEQHRMDLVEAMVPGMSSALVEVFGESGSRGTSSTVLVETNASAILYTKLEKVRALVKKTKSIEKGFGQYPGLYAEHPMLTNSQLRDDYKESKCPGVPETKLIAESDSLFSKHIINGCTSPVYVPHFDVITPACFGHDACLNCKQNLGLSYCHDTFYHVINNRCSAFYSNWWNYWDWHSCKAQAVVMWVAVKGFGNWYSEEPKTWCDASDGGEGTNICAKLVSGFDEDSMARVDPYV